MGFAAKLAQSSVVIGTQSPLGPFPMRRMDCLTASRPHRRRNAQHIPK
jgi:hypothetical protein